MTEFALSPSTKWDATSSPYRSPRVMLEAGELAAYRVRGNGTMRHVSLYPVHSTERETAEFISDRIDVDGASVQAVARELHVSTATVRRYLEGLELTEEIEADEWEDLYFDSQGLPVFTLPFGEEEEAAEDEAVAPNPRRTRTMRKCVDCGTTLYTRNRADKVHGALGYEDMCAKCYDEAGWENTHSDQGHSMTNRDAECPVCAKLPTVSEVCNCAADALGNNWHTPGCPLAPTISIDAPGAHNEDEPSGTTAEELPAVLTKSLERTVAAGNARLANQRPTLHLCVDSACAVHAGGTQPCKAQGAEATDAEKNAALLRPIPRRTRSHG